MMRDGDGRSSRAREHDPAAIEKLFIELFLDAHPKSPARITLDPDATDDRIHGHQRGRFFHGDNDGYRYLRSTSSGCGMAESATGAVSSFPRANGATLERARPSDFTTTAATSPHEATPTAAS